MSDQDVPKSEEEIQDSVENEPKDEQEKPVQADVIEQSMEDADHVSADETTIGDEEKIEKEPTDEPAEDTVKESEDLPDEEGAKEHSERPTTEEDIQEESGEPQEETEQGEEQPEPQADHIDSKSELDAVQDIIETKEDKDSISFKYDIELTSDQEQVEDEQIESHPLDELTDQQVIDLVQELETDNRHLYLENKLFESFLQENEPSLLDGLNEIINYCLIRSSSTMASEKDCIERRHSSYLDRNKYKLDSYTSITSVAEGKGPKINLSQKTDMIMRAMEESQTSLEAFLKKCNITKRNLKAELEEFNIREAEIKEGTEIFEYSVVTQGVDKLTQRIPAEKFIRYMEEWLKSAQLQIEKLRLRIATLKVQYKKVSQQLIQRQELGENVHAVDFDQLEIENKHFIEKIEQKNIHLIELKKMNGGANLVLSTHKKFLQKQQEDCNKLIDQITEKNKQIEATEIECETAEEELQAEIEKFENCKKLKNQYTVPDVMEYVRLKDKLHEIRKNIKVWMRRKKIQDIALNTCLREMKNLTSKTEIDPAWFEEMQSVSDESGSEIMLT